MTPFYTKTGDDGYTGLLGEGRVAKYDQRLETIGTVDEASAALGIARAASLIAVSKALLLEIQRDLYRMMAELAATPENVERFRSINASRVTWLEEQIDTLSETQELPGEFVVPGDSQAGAAMALARTIVRRAERHLALLFHRGEVENQNLLQYLNRLSSLCFILELCENRAAGADDPTLARQGE